MAVASTTQLQVCLDRLNAGDPSARDELIARAYDRLRCIAGKMLHGYPGLKPFADTDDVLQSALLRLLRALDAVTLPSALDFLRLAATEIRRELIDLTRHHGGPRRAGLQRPGVDEAPSSDDPIPQAADPSDSTYEPGRLAMWREFHERVAALPEAERDVFDLLWYQGLTRPEAAQVLGVAVPTVKRRWLSARLRLHAALQGEPPVI